MRYRRCPLMWVTVSQSCFLTVRSCAFRLLQGWMRNNGQQQLVGFTQKHTWSVMSSALTGVHDGEMFLLAFTAWNCARGTGRVQTRYPDLISPAMDGLYRIGKLPTRWDLPGPSLHDSCKETRYQEPHHILPEW